MSVSRPIQAQAARWLGQWIGPLALGLVLCLVYWPTAVWMWQRWWAADSYYSHGVLVPVVSVVLVYMCRRRLSEMTVSGSAWGILLLSMGALGQLVSAFGRIHFVSGYSLIPLLASVFVALYLLLHFTSPGRSFEPRKQTG